MSDISDLENLLDEGNDFSRINPKISESSEHISTVVMDTGFESWGTFISRGVIYQNVESKFAAPSDVLGDEEGTYVVLTISWSGDREGFFRVLVQEGGVKGAVAFFLALAMGTEPDVENTQLDEEAMDAFSELANTFVQQGAQALRGDADVGGKVDLKLEKTDIVDFSKSDPDAEFGAEDLMCHKGQLTIEGLPPVDVYFLMSVSCTGMSAEITQSELVGNSEVQGIVEEHPERVKHRNLLTASRIPVPVVVVLATTKKRVENIKELAPGSIIEFKKFAGEFLDVCADNTKFAEGEVVIVNQHFGIQLRKIVPQVPPPKALKR